MTYKLDRFTLLHRGITGPSRKANENRGVIRVVRVFTLFTQAVKGDDVDESPVLLGFCSSPLHRPYRGSVAAVNAANAPTGSIGSVEWFSDIRDMKAPCGNYPVRACA